MAYKSNRRNHYKHDLLSLSTIRLETSESILLRKEINMKFALNYNKYPVYIAFLSAAIAGLGPILSKQLLSYFSISLALATWFFFAYMFCPTLKIVTLVNISRFNPFIQEISVFRELPSKDKWIASFSVILVSILGPSFFFGSLIFLDAKIVAVLALLNITFGVGFSFIILKEKVTFYRIFGTLIILSGTLFMLSCIASSTQQTNLQGVFAKILEGFLNPGGYLAVLSAFVYGLQRVLSKLLLAKHTGAKTKKDIIIMFLRMQYLAGFVASMLFTFGIILFSDRALVLKGQILIPIVIAIIAGFVFMSNWSLRYNIQSTRFPQSKLECILAMSSVFTFVWTYLPIIFSGYEQIISDWPLWLAALIAISGAILALK
jgi:drug/metabolite transporter (DMT)-like permease